MNENVLLDEHENTMENENQTATVYNPLADGLENNLASKQQTTTETFNGVEISKLTKRQMKKYQKFRYGKNYKTNFKGLH